MALILDGTNGLSDVDGTAGTPAIRGSDANTGVFFGTDIVGVSTGGSERMRVDASGNVGIGTSSPSISSRLHVVGNRTFLDSGDEYTLRIGTVANGIGAYIGSTAANVLNFYNGTGNERARIDSSGRLLVGATSAGVFNTASLQVFNSDSAALFTSSSASDFGITAICMRTASDGGEQIRFCVNNSTSRVGHISSTSSSTSYNTSSDYRLKHDIAPMTGALARVAALKPVTYKWNVDDSTDEGFIAHELAEVCPSAVTATRKSVLGIRGSRGGLGKALIGSRIAEEENLNYLLFFIYNSRSRK